MSYLVLARKYRPRNFTEMVGQEHVVQALSNALTQQRLHHAYLFTGTLKDFLHVSELIAEVYEEHITSIEEVHISRRLLIDTRQHLKRFWKVFS
jgi:replication-associated recombination protein RarA